MPPLLPQERSRRPYFAFGSNMLATQMHQRCPAAQDRGMARLDGWQFLINQEGYATIIPEQSAYVLGVLWSLTSASEAALDDYEEIATGLYTKAYIEIQDTPALVYLATRAWYDATGALAQKLVAPRGYDLRLVIAGGKVVGAVRRVAAAGEWRTNVALGARREPAQPPAEASEIAVAAAQAIDGALVGIDLLPADVGTWVVLEVNGAVDFTSAYSLDEDVFAAASAALLAAPVEPSALVG